MRIDGKLNFVFPVETANHGTAYVHSMPVSRSVFETYYDVLGRVFTKCFDGQDPKHIALTAPQLALPALKSVAIAAGNWDTPAGVRAGLLNEITRLTSIMYVGVMGWESVPLEVAMKRNVMDEDNEAEIMSNLVFFTSISKVAPKALAGTFLEMAGSLREWQFTSSLSTEFMSSLQTLTKEEDTTATPLQVVA
jgi:hypothetical protein